MAVEYRICWAAGSNISFRGATDWEEAEDPDATADDTERWLEAGANSIEGLEMALEASRFEWWVETRESA